MLETMTPKLQKDFVFDEACGMIKNLRIIFQVQAKQERIERLNVFVGCKITEGSSMSARLVIRVGKISKKNTGNDTRKGKGKTTNKGKGKGMGQGKPPGTNPTPKPEPAVDSDCFHFNEKGHWKCNYPKYQDEVKKNKANQVDTPGRKNVIELKDGNMELHVGNETRVAVKSIRNIISSFQVVLIFF
uniref:Uncharacterized protein n=1 Tax=Lactuca sativa TaxID=4236 RepID=A0A9R1W0H4_LACSA|nr:hypothetical protein LSAT_V11C400181160 [Lactuca sativa]